MSVQAKLMTADELLAMPDDGKRYELVNGELIEMSPGKLWHGIVADRIASSLSRFVAMHRLGWTPSSDTGYVLTRNPDTVRAPDASFIARDRVQTLDAFGPAAPDLAVEVISPSDRYTEVDVKVRQYIAAGARMVIVVNPRNNTATATTPKGATLLTIDDVIEGGDVVPGWTLPLRELFAD
jgi:Uma2 family endonuclease